MGIVNRICQEITKESTQRLEDEVYRIARELLLAALAKRDKGVG